MRARGCLVCKATLKEGDILVACGVVKRDETRGNLLLDNGHMASAVLNEFVHVACLRPPPVAP